MVLYHFFDGVNIVLYLCQTILKHGFVWYSKVVEIHQHQNTSVFDSHP